MKINYSYSIRTKVIKVQVNIMSDYFNSKIKQLLNAIIKTDSSICTRDLIISYISDLDINGIGRLGDYYIKYKKDCKEKGVVYTPTEVSSFMIANTIKASDIIGNPFIKILDPSCGCGAIIIECFIYLKKLYEENLEEINKTGKLQLKHEDIARHIIDNNLYGIDIEVEALNILKIDLCSISGYMNQRNFMYGDFLLDNFYEDFDIIIGNPPYIGHKALDSDYSNKIRKEYENIFRDKGDLSYCFISKACQIISSKGRITFITSRYFLESQSGQGIRNFLLNQCSLDKIVDFYGIRPFKGIGIDPVILFLSKAGNEDIEVLRPSSNTGTGGTAFLQSVAGSDEKEYKSIYVKKNDLSGKPWMLLESNEKNLVKKIESKCSKTLGDICHSYQGIITGCDKAFIVRSEVVAHKGLEKEVIRPWVKSSFIGKNEVRREDYYIIYTNLIDIKDKYPNVLKHVELYRESLMRRRECRNGVRKWYELQWGRTPSIFEGVKIVFPYKAAGNRFALDEGSYFSADIYALILKDIEKTSYGSLMFLLNSLLYEFYFKTFAKKLGGSLYEYYPNNLMKLRIPDNLLSNQISEQYLYDYFELSKKEINIINNKGNR
jgi:adenine-specific DNA-methyltransferase